MHLHHLIKKNYYAYKYHINAKKMIEKTQYKPEETFKLNKRKAAFNFDQPLDLGSEKWMMGAKTLKV